MPEHLILNHEECASLIEQYGSPLYVYDEAILRRRCREIKMLCSDSEYHPQYSVKANANIELLKIIRSEGLSVDAMSIGEAVQEEAAGFTKQEIVFCTNNMTPAEMQLAYQHGRIAILDSLDQLEEYIQINHAENVGIRINPGIGDGHSTKVITGGKTKFGIPLEDVPKAVTIAEGLGSSITLAHMHVGSQYLNPTVFLHAADILLNVVEQMPAVTEVDFGGGFGIPYQNEERLNLKELGQQLQHLVTDFRQCTNRTIEFCVEPGRYITAECGELLGTVTSIKRSGKTLYAGTNIGFNVLMRPILYNAHHPILAAADAKETAIYTVTGNICETGDILARDIELPKLQKGNFIGILEAGAYGFSMASQYNGRLRPAEVLRECSGSFRLIRKRDELSDLLHQLP